MKQFLLVRCLYLPVLVLGVVTMACEEVFDPAMLDADPRLVVISQFSPGAFVRVRVSQSRSVVDNAPFSYVRNAQVELWRDSMLLHELQLVEEETPYYASPDFLPEEGVTYTIKVEAPGFPAVSAQSYVPEQIRLEEVEDRDLMLDTATATYRFTLILRFEDPAGIANFYHINILQEVLSGQGDGNDRSTFEKIFFDDLYNNRYRTASLDGGLLYRDEDFDGRKAEIEIPVRVPLQDLAEQRLGQTVVEFRTVTQDYFLFQSSVSKQRSTTIDPLSEPALLYNNIRNGHGIFAGYNATFDSIVVNL